MMSLGRKHRPFYRLVAIDGKQPRNGRYLEELGSYDPMIPNTDERVKLNAERVKYWLSVGAKASEKTAVLLKKYLDKQPAPASQPGA
jgi:small subunit ribosomal protein S16